MKRYIILFASLIIPALANAQIPVTGDVDHRGNTIQNVNINPIGAATGEVYAATRDFEYHFTQTYVSLANVNAIRIREAGFQRYGGGQSWTTETLGDADRGANAEFPPVAIFVGSDTDALIYDLDGNEWMEFDASVNASDAFSAYGISALDMLNGFLFCGYPHGILYSDFFSDGDFAITSTTYYQNKGNISERNSGLGVGTITVDLEIVAPAANDIHLFRDSSGNVNFAYASDNGVSISRNWGTDRAEIWDLTDATYPSFGNTRISSDGKIYTLWGENSTTSRWVWIVREDTLPTADVSGEANYDHGYSGASVPGTADDVIIPVDNRINDLEVIEYKSIHSNNHIIVISSDVNAHNGGVALIEESTDVGDSYTQRTNTDYYSRSFGEDNRLSLDFDNDSSTVATSHDGVGATVALTGSPTYPDGIINSAIEFDGSTQYGTIYDSDDFSFGDGSTDEALSIGGWFYFDNFTTSHYIFNKANQQTDSYEFRCLSGVPDGLLYFILHDENLANSLRVNTTNSVSAGNWSYIVFVYSGSGYPQIYINGEIAPTSETTTGSYTSMHNTTEPITLGAYIGSSGTPEAFFDGKMDQVFITQQELTADVIKKLYQRDKKLYNSGLPALLAGTSDNVNDTAVSKNGELLIVGTDNALAIHDAETLGLVKTINTGKNYSLVDVYGNPFYDAPGSGSVIIAYNSTDAQLEIYRDDINLQAVLAEARAQDINKERIETDDLIARRANLDKIYSSTGEESIDIDDDSITVEPYTSFVNGYGSPSDTQVKPGWVVTTDDDDSSLINLRNVTTGKYYPIPVSLMTRSYSPHIESSTYTMRAADVPNITPTVTLQDLETAVAEQEEGEPVFSNRFQVVGATVEITINEAQQVNGTWWVRGSRFDVVRDATQERAHRIREYIINNNVQKVDSIDVDSLPDNMTSTVEINNKTYKFRRDDLLIGDMMVQNKRQQDMIDVLKKITVQMAKELINRGVMDLVDFDLTQRELDWLTN